MSRNDNVTAGCLTLLVLIAIGLVVGVVQLGTTRVETATVQSKERVCSDRDDCRYLIFTDRGVYENTDTLLFGKFNSSDIYGELKPGHTYRLKVNGWRVQVTSSYPNILAVEGEAAQ